jgi:hypothetical protein
MKSNCVKYKIEKERKKPKQNLKLIDTQIGLYKKTIAKIDNLGHKDMPPEIYEEWVKSVEEEKAKRNITTNR